MAVTITWEEVPVGSASVFRSTMNNNFDTMGDAINNIYSIMVNLTLSADQPLNQKAGDFWFKTV